MTHNSPTNHQDLSSFHAFYPAPVLLQRYIEEHPDSPPIHHLIKELFTNIKDKIVLDLGCGIGSRFCEGLLYYGLPPEQLYSLDPDEKNFKKDEYPRLNKIVASAESIPQEDETFDVVHSCMMTPDNPHIDYKKTLREISRVLKRRGFYIAFEGFDFSQKHLDKGNQDFFPIVEDNSFLREIGFKPMERLSYFKNDKHDQPFYIFEKA